MDVDLNELVEVELPVEDERPPWLPDNFKSPEDFRKSYDEAQATLQRSMQRAAEAENTLNEILAAQEEEQPPSSLLEAAWRDDPDAVIAAAAEGAARAALDAWERAVHQAHGTSTGEADESFAGQVDATLTARYPDWHAIRPKLAGLIEAEPRLLPEEALNSPGQTIDALERLYATVKLPELVRAQQEQTRLAKIRAQTQGGTLGRPDSGSGDFAEQVRQSIRDASTSAYRQGF